MCSHTYVFGNRSEDEQNLTLDVLVFLIIFDEDFYILVSFSSRWLSAVLASFQILYTTRRMHDNNNNNVLLWERVFLFFFLVIYHVILNVNIVAIMYGDRKPTDSPWSRRSVHTIYAFIIFLRVRTKNKRLIKLIASTVVKTSRRCRRNKNGSNQRHFSQG